MKNKTLLVLAAGMGSRYGGLKQVEKFGPNGEFLIDYSVYDAVKNGFNKVVFIIKEENYKIFKDTIGKRIENFVNVEYVFQNLDNVPKKFSIPEDRVKPLGTAHAILCAKEKIDGNFIIINADDFYGREAFEVASKFLDRKSDNYGIIGYYAKNTITENGSVKRGICFTKYNNLKEIVESSIWQENGALKAKSLSNDENVKIDNNTLVSMNMIAFNNSIFKYLDKYFVKFLSNSDLNKDEYLIPDVLSLCINNNEKNVKVVKTDAKWSGVTYKEDKESVKNYINSLIKNNVYPMNLWEGEIKK